MEIDRPKQTLEEQLKFPKVGDLIEWVNLLEVWSNDKWVDSGGPYFDIEDWNADMIKMGIVIEEAVVEDIFHWTVWSWRGLTCWHISSTTDKVRGLSSSSDNSVSPILHFFARKNKIK